MNPCCEGGLTFWTTAPLSVTNKMENMVTPVRSAMAYLKVPVMSV